MRRKECSVAGGGVKVRRRKPREFTVSIYLVEEAKNL